MSRGLQSLRKRGAKSRHVLRRVPSPEVYDDKEVIICGCISRWDGWCSECEADPKHRRVILSHFGLMEGKANGVSFNGDNRRKEQAEHELEEVDGHNANTFTVLEARMISP